MAEAALGTCGSLRAFRAVPPQARGVRDALFADWRALIVERTLRTAHDGGPPVPGGGWATALVDAVQEGATPVLHAAVRAALLEVRAAIAGDRRAARDPRPAFDRRTLLLPLAVLTRDLEAITPALKRSAPKLLRLLSTSIRVGPGPLDAARREWWARLRGRELSPEILAFWKDNVARFVPDPGEATGDYSECADWLAAVDEINPPAARELLIR